MCTFNYFLLVLFSLCTAQDAKPYIVTLRTSKPNIIENDDLLMICESNNTYKYPYSYWNNDAKYDKVTDLPLLGFARNICRSSYPLNDSSLYNGTCYRNETFTLKLISVNRKQHGERWQCLRRYNHLDTATSNTIVVYVKVPVTNVTIVSHQNDVLPLCEFSTETIKCKTSEARPKPTITWLLRNSTKETYLVSASDTSTSKNNLSVATSTLDISPNRTLSGWEIVCLSSDIPKYDLNASIRLDIKHPPDNPPVLNNPSIENRGTYSVIENQEGKLTCVVTGGNPLASLRWDCINDGNRTVVMSQSVKRDVVWSASRNDIYQCKCIAEHSCHKWNGSVLVYIKVLYPPVIDKIGDVSVIEGTMVSIPCNATPGVPENMTFQWKKENDEIKTTLQDLFIPNVTRNDTSKYKCEVTNVMQPTEGEQKRGNDSTVFHLDVLYPACVDEIKDMTIEEGSDINVTCPVLHGNPTNITVTWTPSGHSGNIILHFPHVSRTYTGTYICSVNSTMKPTLGNPIWEVKTGQFHLRVLYNATVTDFFIENQTEKDKTTVYETDNITFLCLFESDPPPNAAIIYEKQEVFFSNENTIRYRKHNIQCNDKGEYVCSGMNDFNYGTPSTKSIALYVYCSPRPDPNITLKTHVVSARNMSTTLTFTAFAYPKPGPQGFTWYFVNESDRFNLKNNSNVLIQNSDTQSNLTIRNVSELSFGQYRLQIMNSIDVFEQTFRLTPFEVPDPPVIYDWTSGETYVSIFIEAGFNGGYSQRFKLRYTEASTNNWSNIFTITDSILNVFNITSLMSGNTYRVSIFAENDIGNSSDVWTLVTTKARSTTSKPTVSSSSKTSGIIAGSVVGAIVVICIVLAGIVFLRKRKRHMLKKGIYQNVPFSGQKLKTKKKTTPLHVDETSLSDLQEVDDVPNVTSEPTEYYNSPEVIEKIERVKVSELYSYVTGKSDDSFEADYQKLPTGLQKPCTFARKPENIAMNRYNGIYPYDHSRVKLQGHPDFFINACYIDGYKRSKAYIASLGPTSKTTDDFATFWQMIWYEKSDIIVMLTNLKEPSGMKCEQYWPAIGTIKTYGDVCAENEKEVVFAEYTVRHLRISKDDELRSIIHLHYTAWPDKKVPEDATSLLEFRLRIKDTPTSYNGPIIIHCSAGIGRTGTLIALDRLIEEGQCEGSVNVFECVNSIREQRVKMVQTAEQYIYIYKALVNALSFECETIPIQSFQAFIDSTNNNIYSKHFQQLTVSVQTDSKKELDAFAINEKEKDKNRIGADIPGSGSRVFLYQDRVDEQSDYVNAVYVNSLRKKDFFIAAQSPLPKTVSDFVCMVYQEGCTCIVTMDDLNEPGMNTVGQYLPADKCTLTVGNYIVSCSKLETKPQYVVRKMKIKFKGKFESGEKVIYHFQYTKWMKGNVIPSSANDFVQFVNDMEEYASELGEDKSHVLVHCLKANERCGLFCAVAVLMQKMKFERQVNVLYTLRHLRNRRRSAITDMEQLKFCYLAVSAYIKMYTL